MCVFVWLWLWWMVAHVEQVMDRSRTDETGDGGGYPFGRKCASIFQFWDDPLIMSSPFLFPLLETAAQERVATHQVTRAAVGPVWRGTGRSDCSMLTYCPDSIDGLHLAFFFGPNHSNTRAGCQTSRPSQAPTTYLGRYRRKYTGAESVGEVLCPPQFVELGSAGSVVQV